MPRAVPQPHGADMPVAVSEKPPAAGALTAAIAVLRADLETHQRAASEAKTLITRLETYANGHTAPSAPAPVAAAEPPTTPAPDARKHRPSIDDATRRARQAASMRKYRASKAAATPKAKSRKRQRKADAAEEPPPDPPPAAPPPPADTPPPPPPAEEAAAAPPPPAVAEPPERNKRAERNLRRKPARAARLGHKETSPAAMGCTWNQSPTVLTPWEVDPATGVLSRERRTAGETPTLRDSPLP